MKRRPAPRLYSDLVQHVTDQLEGELQSAALVIQEKDREIKMLRAVRLELIEELRDYRARYPHVHGWEGCAERSYTPMDYGHD